MADKKIIAIVGATGAQGGGLARAILADPKREFEVWALTRDPDKAQAKALAELGAHVVKTDIDDIKLFPAAIEGAYGLYCVTNFWEHFSAKREIEQARNMAITAKGCGIKHIIWSTLEDTRKAVPIDDPRMPILQERYKVPHFDGKAEADAEFTSQGLPVTFLRTTFYWENLLTYFTPQLNADGSYTLVFPIGTARMSGIAVADIGKCAYNIFKRPELKGQTISIAGEHLTGEQMAAKLSSALAVTVNFYAPAPSEYRAYGFPGAAELGNMFEFYAVAEADFVGARDLNYVRQLNPELQSFDDWLAANASLIPLKKAEAAAG